MELNRNKPSIEEWNKNLEALIREGSYNYIQNNKKVTEPKNNKSENFKLYRDKVFELTEKVKNQIEHISKRGWKNHHIDHKISIHYGFENNISPKLIADVSNLRLISYRENMLKNRSNFIDDKNKWILEQI